MDTQTDPFETGYKKFTDVVEKFDLFPSDRKGIVLAFSGGKDISLLCDFVQEYKKRVRPDISLDMFTVAFPGFIYDSSDPTMRDAVDEAIDYWAARGFRHKMISPTSECSDELLDGDDPCYQCIRVKHAMFPQAMSQYKDVSYCIGLTLDDTVGWLIELFLLAGGRGHWKDIKNTNPELFDQMTRLAVRVYNKIHVERDNLLFVRPLITFVEEEVRTIVAQRNYPLIPENCGEIRGRSAFRDTPRRDVAAALGVLRKRYPSTSAIGREALYADYSNVIEYFNSLGLLPDIEECEKMLASVTAN
jgi:tRNA(Ile)-lysidine synthase TilS/MesJ